MINIWENTIGKPTASRHEKCAEVIYHPDLVSLEKMKQALIKSGYVTSAVENKDMNQEILQPFGGKITELQPDELVCYCFDYTRKDIEQNCIENGTSTIMAKIATQKKHRRCNCANKNPKGS